MSTVQTTPLAPATRAPVKPSNKTVASSTAATSKRSGAIATGAARRWLAVVSDRWLPRLAWSLQRSGRVGLSGAALLMASVMFLVSTHLPLAREVAELRSQVETAPSGTSSDPRPVSASSTAMLRSLPTRGEAPALLGVLLKQADTAHLSIDTGKYETTALKSGGVTSYQVSFPVTGPYPQVRQFIDATLTALPAVALSELSLTRKSIGDGSVEAQIRLTFFTRETP